jgi:hypothetical protein
MSSENPWWLKLRLEIEEKVGAAVSKRFESMPPGHMASVVFALPSKEHPLLSLTFFSIPYSFERDAGCMWTLSNGHVWTISTRVYRNPESGHEVVEYQCNECLEFVDVLQEFFRDRQPTQWPSILEIQLVPYGPAQQRARL